MSSPDVTQVTAGPAQFQLNTTEIGHTSGGIGCTITPQNRARNVDEFGVGEVAYIHQGDEVRLSVPFAEWAQATLAEVYNPGNNQTALGSGSAPYMGVGRSSGYIYTTKNARVIPRLTQDVDKRIEMFKATPIGEISLMHNADDDRIFETEFACIVDETQTDGELIGKLQLSS